MSSTILSMQNLSSAAALPASPMRLRRAASESRQSRVLDDGGSH